jgi:hypothetical protein
MKEQLRIHLAKRLDQFVGSCRDITYSDVEKKIDSLSKRNAELVKVDANAKIKRVHKDEGHSLIDYDVHMRFLIKQKNKLYIEEAIEHREASFYQDRLYNDNEKTVDFSVPAPSIEESLNDSHEEMAGEMRGFYYDRRKAVQYAEKWWNSYNPAYKTFEVDCTNFISQCLHAGGSPMRGYPNKGHGWWLQNSQWSFSWAVANSLRLYLASSHKGLHARQVQSPEELLLGDVICYDFQGDGRFDHNTVVTDKDANGMPLVNAHTYNSRARYWAYEDSTAYTPNIKYKFFSIISE